MKPALVALILAVTVIMLPIAVPVLSVENYLRYQSKLPFSVPASEKGHLRARLSHRNAWEFGWEEMTAAMARLCYSPRPEDCAIAAIFGKNFGEAGAIDRLGPKCGLPKAIGNHQSYWLWGPRDYSGELLIIFGRIAPQGARSGPARSRWPRRCTSRIRIPGRMGPCCPVEG